MTPHSSISASTSAARRHALVTSRFSMISASICCVCGSWPGAQRLHHQVGQSQDELALDDVLGDHLVTRVHVLAGLHRHVVAQVHVAQQEHALPGDQDVVEEGDGVHFLEPRAQGMIEARALQIETFAAQKFQPRRMAGQGEGERRPPRRVGGQVDASAADRRRSHRRLAEWPARGRR